MVKKRLMALLVCGALMAGSVAGLAGCKKDDSIKLTVWGSASQQETLKQMVEDFKAANPDTKYNITVGLGEEEFAYENVQRDPEAAADVFSYPSDQLIPLLRIGALARLGGDNLAQVKANNSADSVEAGSIEYGTAEEKVYGYPFAADNGYFMYYDKSVISDSEVATLEGIISACERASEKKSKKIAWALDTAFYTAGWFFTFGCSYSVDYDYSANYKETVDIDFNNEGGIKASKAMAKLANSSAFAGKGTSNATITDGFKTHSLAVAVSGNWNAKAIQEALGEDYGVCKLPTVEVDGETKQLYSFKGYKLFGVNAYSKNRAEAHKLAAFLANEKNQKTRFEKSLTSPTNTAVAELDDVKNNATIMALNAQNAFTVKQKAVPTTFWSPVGSYGLNIIDKLVLETVPEGDKNHISYQTQLNTMVNKIKGNA